MYCKSLLPFTHHLLKSRYLIDLQHSQIILPCVMKKFSFSTSYSASSSILKLAERGIWKYRFPESCSEFEESLSCKSAVVYAGFDPTSDSLHIGNLLVLNALIHFQRKGHQVIALIGGGTARIGDPSGKNEERPIIALEDIERNSKKIRENIENIFKNHERYFWKTRSNKDLHPVRILDNFSWYKDLNAIDLLRNIGKHMKMGVLLRRSTIRERLESNEPLSFTEFSYQIMQAYDWLYLLNEYNCNVQIGGNDQMGNILIGHELISRKEGRQVTGLTVPLITSESGSKLGKTAGTPVWLNPNKTSPYEFYQFFLRVKDSEVENLLKLLTFIPMAEIETAIKHHHDGEDQTVPQKKLAKHLTLLVHGEEGLLKAQQATSLVFGNDSTVLAEMKAADVIELFKGSIVKSLILKPGLSVLDMAMQAGCFSVEKRAVHVIEAGGFSINEARVTNPFLVLIPGLHILPNGLTLVRVGKRNYYIVQWKI